MPTFDVRINIYVSIPIIGDESISRIPPPQDFVFNKINLKDYAFKDKITDGQGRILTEYINAVHQGEDDYIICLEKSIDRIVQNDKPANALAFVNGHDFDDLIRPLHDDIESTVFRFFSLLHLYKEGEIARKSSFYRYTTKEGICSTERLKEVTIADAITIIRYPMVFTAADMPLVADMLYNHTVAYTMLKNIVIDDLEYTYHTLDDSTNYKNLMTPLEVLFLSNNYGDKKEMLAKRISVFIGGSDSEMKTIYDYVKNSYKDRSDAIHEGVTTNITRDALDELRNLTRKVTKKYMVLIEQELASDPAKTFEDIKRSLINYLKNVVVSKNALGIW